jgi:bacterioferritin
MNVNLYVYNNSSAGMKKGAFLTEIEEIGRRAHQCIETRQHIERGTLTSNYESDLETVTRLLNEALATEMVCVLRYKCHHYMAKGIHSKNAAEEFLAHAAEEQGYADQIATRIIQLNGEPNFSPEGALTRSHSEYVEGETLLDMIREDLIAERIAIESYSEIIRYLGETDSTSRWMLEEILASEEEHAEDMKTLLERIGSDEKRNETWTLKSRPFFVGNKLTSAKSVCVITGAGGGEGGRRLRSPSPLSAISQPSAVRASPAWTAAGVR